MTSIEKIIIAIVIMGTTLVLSISFLIIWLGVSLIQYIN